jgi:3D (Asp-Asp-Asp) domain-containing protein
VQRFRRLAASVAATGLLALGGVVATAAVASAGTIGSCGAQGDFATCDASATANHPLTITVTVTSSPDESVTVFWDTVCSQGSGAGTSSGNFTATTPVTRTISHPYHQPDSCDVGVAAGLNNNGKWIKVSIASSSTPPPPAVHQIKGYDGKCADDTGNSSAKGAKIQLWTCNKTAAQNWSFSNGELVHNGKCANDQNDGGSGAKVILYTCSRASNDLWTHKSNGEYVLKAHSGKICLDDPGYSKKNGTQLVVYTCKDTANQRWTLP